MVIGWLLSDPPSVAESLSSTVAKRALTKTRRARKGSES
jgi:hypothetical protein